jgi:hypothetical protein
MLAIAFVLVAIVSYVWGIRVGTQEAWGDMEAQINELERRVQRLQNDHRRD